jgi:hypothetical protein
MAQERVNPNIRYYLPGDPYYYEVDNLPLHDLQENDSSLQAQIDALNTRIDAALSTPNKHGFRELLPYWHPNQAGVLKVKDGNFIARVNTKATFENGLMERLWGSDVDSNSVYLRDSGWYPNNDEPRTLAAARAGREIYEAKSSARTAVINYKDVNNVNVPGFDDEDFTDADAPDYRIDLLFIQASPSLDESNEFRPRFGNTEETPRLGYVKGAYFRVDNLADEGRVQGRIFDEQGLEGKLLGLSQVDVYQRDSGTVPSPDDVVNGSYKSPTTATGGISHTPGITPLSLDVWAENQYDSLGVFCLPVAYIKVPRGYRLGDVLPQESIIDIRPLFRSTELTLSERQAISTSHAPSLNNRLLTLKDPDYTHFKDEVVQGLGARPQLDHEGRIQTLEAKMRENADIEAFQPVNIRCMDGQETAPYYTDSNEEDFDRRSGFLDFWRPSGEEEEGGGTGWSGHHNRNVWTPPPGVHQVRNTEPYIKTVRALRYKVGANAWMLFTTLHFKIADEAVGVATETDEGTLTRTGDSSNNADLPMPSGYYRLNTTQLGYTGGPVDAILCTPNMEMKWGGDAWAYDIFRHDDWEDPESGAFNSGFIDFDLGCTDTEYQTTKHVTKHFWHFWHGSHYHYSTVDGTQGSMNCSITLVGMSNTPDLYEGAEIATHTIY